nr:pentatricopeptide repeat-containing protein At3g22670, mitochondrial-like isoform X1 [Quercus suber]XP_023907755.1 pentatricopeptide repeat-containing protein At3g22670, mitochondrial-like isoform X2 [Quercus suber]
MLSSKFQIFKLLSHSRKTKPFIFLYHPLCTMTDSTQLTESPELPSWVKFSDTQNPSNPDSDDDFVIPSLARWVDNYKFHDHSQVVKQMLSENTETEVDKICKILKNRYPSPDNAAEALNGSGFIASNSLVEQLLKRFSNDWVPAFGVFAWAKMQTGYRHSHEVYDSMVDILGKAEQFHTVWELVEEMNELGGYVTLVTMSKVMRRLAKAGKYKEAIEAFRKIEMFGVSKDTTSMNVLMDALVKEGSVEDAHDVFLTFKKVIPLSAHTFNVLIHGWCKARKLDHAKKAMEDMEKHGFQPDVFSYTCFIEAYCREKDFRKVDKILEEMKDKGCRPSEVTYTIVMHALGKAKRLNEALEVYEKMKRNGCVPDASIYSSLIFILGKSGRLKDARDVFEDMTKQGVSRNALTYNTLISCYCVHLQEEAAMKLLQQMEEDTCKPNLKTYGPLLKICCQKKRMKVLYFLLDHMFRNDISPEVGTYSLLVHGLCKNGKLEHACLFFEEMVLKGMVPKDCTYKMLTEGLEGKNMTKAKEHIEKLMSRTQNNEAKEHIY